jgi:peptide chain release factor 1
MSTLAHHIATVFPSLLVPPSTTAHLSSLLELKAGVGGSEASLFAADLLRMYLRFANTMDWKTQVLSSRESDGGGLKDAIVEVTGRRSYDDLRWETGIHRVQRVPATESSGRVHTSTVAVLASFSLPHMSQPCDSEELVIPVGHTNVKQGGSQTRSGPVLHG